ncbi:unnamed protein product, partial [Strongylus vulgaris]
MIYHLNLLAPNELEEFVTSVLSAKLKQLYIQVQRNFIETLQRLDDDDDEEEEEEDEDEDENEDEDEDNEDDDEDKDNED